MKNTTALLLFFFILTGCSTSSKLAAPQTPKLTLQSLDRDSSDSVEYDEYRDTMLKYFDSFDKDRNGNIDFLKEGSENLYLKKSDLNTDGKINIIEFIATMTKSFNDSDKNKNQSLSAKEFVNLKIK